MIRMFSYEGYAVVVEPEALLLAPFKALYTRDKSKDKARAMQELAFVYFFTDPRSDYQYLTDEEARMKAIKEGEGLPDSWMPDDVVKEAIKFYKSFKPTSAALLEDTRYAVDKLRMLLREIDLNETDANGKPIYTLNTITQTIKQIPALVRDLDAAEKALAKDLASETEAKGGQEKALGEDI